MPRAGRRASSTQPSGSSTTSTVTPRRGRLRFGRGAGYFGCVPARHAAQVSAKGHTVHAGRARVQSVAPRSMIACV